MLECLVTSMDANEAPADHDYLDNMSSVWYEMRQDNSMTYIDLITININAVRPAQLRIWINENIKGYCWSFDDTLCSGLLFEHAREAMYFKLKWG